ncbi:longitudinals lacking protein, isoforms A/B/D/L-like [Homalodisca vitripennis]|uniref:longitudinals lacking protein, isoforms A/B/D/L-like n=1 Tax=Homalodisca vitripennis TaxID=197043 RepID=UPI001EEBDA9C|nr:longitudinals lacking protein, isoforms A/B/D/L-like [Homalodisca vitripennis]
MYDGRMSIVSVNKCLVCGIWEKLVIEGAGQKQLQQQAQGQFRCECGKTYLHSASLYNHKTYHCGKDRQFGCPHCPYRSSQKGTLKRHMFVKHLEVFQKSGGSDLENLFDGENNQITGRRRGVH